MTSLRIRRLYNVSRCLDSELVDGFARCALQSFDENATQENAPLNAEADEISARTGLRAKRRHQLRLVARAMHCGETDVVGSNPVVTCKKRPPLSKLEPEQLKRAPSVKPTRCAVDRDWSPSACVPSCMGGVRATRPAYAKKVIKCFIISADTLRRGLREPNGVCAGGLRDLIWFRVEGLYDPPATSRAALL